MYFFLVGLKNHVFAVSVIKIHGLLLNTQVTVALSCSFALCNKLFYYFYNKVYKTSCCKHFMLFTDVSQ